MHRCRKINLSHLPLLSYLPSDITENHVLSTRARKSIQITFFFENWNPVFLRGIWFREHFFQFAFNFLDDKIEYFLKIGIQISLGESRFLNIIFNFWEA